MNNLDKIYIVTQEWGYVAEEPEGLEVIGIFYDYQKAVSRMNSECDITLRESYGTPREYLAHSQEVSVTEDLDSIQIFNQITGKQDMFRIFEKDIEQRDFIVLQFDYDGETFNEHIYIDNIDRNHYDDMWDWWFGAPKESKNPKLNFEVLGKKDRNGDIIADKFQLNVYLNEDCDTPIATFPCCYLRISKSWIGPKEGFSFYYE